MRTFCRDNTLSDRDREVVDPTISNISVDLSEGMHWASVTGPNVVLEWRCLAAHMELRGASRNLLQNGLAGGLGYHD